MEEPVYQSQLPQQADPDTITWIIDRNPDPDYEEHLINVLDRFHNYYYDNYNNYEPTIRFSVEKEPIEIILVTSEEINDEEQDCCICFEKKEKYQICRLNCSHTFCVLCAESSIDSFMKKEITHCGCPLCRKKIEKISVITNENFKLFSKYS